MTMRLVDSEIMLLVMWVHYSEIDVCALKLQFMLIGNVFLSPLHCITDIQCCFSKKRQMHLPAYKVHKNPFAQVLGIHAKQIRM